MRIVIDMQGAQTPGSRNRGIGRYTLSLVHAIVRQAEGHELVLVLNGAFPESIAPIRSAFGHAIAPGNIRVWQAPGPVSMLGGVNEWRRGTAQLMREAFIASLEPDFVLVTSLFEGLGEDFVGSVGMFNTTVPTAVVLYDLIPLIQRSPYLENPQVERWYETRVDAVRRADLLLAISESSRQEGIRYLDFAADACVTISTAADPHFHPQTIGAEQEGDVRARLGLPGPFVMYTGGIDHRKNIEGLIRAYALLPKTLRAAHKLAIVCAVQPHSRAALETLARERGLADGELVLTGFVSEADLTCLYNLCTMFVFPSWHEGFGLPALEAMSCGRAVIGANTSSLPEVIGRADALFDPRDDAAIAAKLEQVLSDPLYRAELEAHGLVQARNFSWDASARKALDAMVGWRARQPAKAAPARPAARPTMAYVSPLPPERSGISDYSAELLPELARHYEIDVIAPQASVGDPWVKANCKLRSVEWFKEHAARYDRVLYHVGNSSFHQHMFGLIEEVPGMIVLHDFFLSGVAAHMEATGYQQHFWTNALYESHGYPALERRYHARDSTDVVFQYPCNLGLLRNALGVIVHSENSRRLARQWYGEAAARDWPVIAHMRVAAQDIDRAGARRQLGLGERDFVVCSFGLLGPTKLNHRLLSAWAESALLRDPDCVLVFVGENAGGEYGAQLLDTMARLGKGDRIRITGWADSAMFRQYLAAADVGVQLRTLSRGETSGTVLDCMNYGLATIVNAHGSMADLPREQVLMLPDEFSDAQLAGALEQLRGDDAARRSLGDAARALILSAHSPRRCADQYAQAIEATYRDALAPALTAALARVEPVPREERDWMRLAEAMAHNFPVKMSQRQWLIDVTGLQGSVHAAAMVLGAHGTLGELLLAPPPGCRVEPVYRAPKGGLMYARRFALQVLGCPEHGLAEDIAECRDGDLLLVPGAPVEAALPLYQSLRDIGVEVQFVGAACA